MAIKNKKEKRFDSFCFALIVVVTLILLFRHHTQPRIFFIKYYIPILIFCVGAFLGMIVLFMIRRYFFNIKETPAFFLTDFPTVFKNIFMAFLVFGSGLYWLFDSINQNFIRYKEIQNADCRVYRISLRSSARRNNNTIAYIFKGHDESINNFKADSDLVIANKEKSYKNYSLSLSYKEGLFSSIIIEDWSFIIHQ